MHTGRVGVGYWTGKTGVAEVGAAARLGVFLDFGENDVASGKKLTLLPSHSDHALLIFIWNE